jgi:ubiquinol-cytochrome c reductase cytochrome b subunit
MSAGKRLLEDIGWNEYLRPFLYKELPAQTGWTATLGTLCALLFGMLAFSGLVLAMYYNPSPDKAYQSIEYIMKDVPMGALLRGIHHWGAGAMVIAVFVHLLANFFAGAFKPPREWTWISGVGLFLLTLGLGFTGYLLPWDMKAYWATVVASNIPRDIPVIGDLITRMVRGGETVSGLTLTRFYAIHMLLLPGLLAATAAFHIYLVRIHGLAEPEQSRDRGEAGTRARHEYRPINGPQEHPLADARGLVEPGARRPYRFYPEHLFRSALVFAVILLGIIALALLRTPPREEIAGTLIDSYLPRPEWYYMWLFQLLTYFPGRWELLGSLAIPLAGIALLFAVPFLGRARVSAVARRPLATAGGVTAIIGIVYLSLMGFEGARPYGQVILVPDRPLTASEARGLYLFADRECAYCHQISGKGGHRTGPDLANVVARHRTREFLARYIRNPQAVSTTSIMPKYSLPEPDLQALADFLLALDFSKHPAKIVKRKELLNR